MVKGCELFISITIICTTILDMPKLSSGYDNQILKFIYNNNGLGAYSFEFETSDGTYRIEDGGLISHPEGESLAVRGEYGYLDHLGRPYSVKYIADIKGFQPQISYDETRFNDRRII